MPSRLRLLFVPFVAIASTATFVFAQDPSSWDQQRTLVAQTYRPPTQSQPSEDLLKQRAQAQADMAGNVQRLLAEVRELRTVMIQLDADGKQKLAALKTQVDDLKINLKDAQRRLYGVCLIAAGSYGLLEQIGKFQREKLGCTYNDWPISPYGWNIFWDSYFGGP